jgi:hypothetical protein
MSNPIYTGVFSAGQTLPAAQLNDVVYYINNHDHGTEANGGAPINQTVINTIIGTMYPVGSIYASTVSTNPETLFGIGTWVAYGQGRFLAGYSSGDPNFGTPGGTGGSATHTNTLLEMASHTHVIPLYSPNNGGNSGVAQNTPGPADSNSATIDSAGGGEAYSILNPYITVYFWNRTA